MLTHVNGVSTPEIQDISATTTKQQGGTGFTGFNFKLVIKFVDAVTAGSYTSAHCDGLGNNFIELRLIKANNGRFDSKGANGAQKLGAYGGNSESRIWGGKATLFGMHALETTVGQNEIKVHSAYTDPTYGDLVLKLEVIPFARRATSAQPLNGSPAAANPPVASPTQTETTLSGFDLNAEVKISDGLPAARVLDIARLLSMAGISF